MVKRLDRIKKKSVKNKLNSKNTAELGGLLVFDTIENIANARVEKRRNKQDKHDDRKSDEAKALSKGMNPYHGNKFLVNECYSKNYFSDQSKQRSSELYNQANRPDQADKKDTRRYGNF